MGVYEYYDQDTDSIVYYVAPSPDSDNEQSTLESESESMASGTTIMSEDVQDYFILHHGRPQIAATNVARWLPSDNIRRYVVHYLIFKWLLGGDYAGPVHEMLALTFDQKKAVLELGTKTGTWTQSMAATFPHVQFRSLDLAPIMAHVPRSNIVFEVYDFTEGLLIEDNSQDIVFINFLSGSVKDYRGLLREAHRVLRPGGLIHLVDFNIQLWDTEDLSVPALRGIDPDTCTKVAGWLEPSSSVWELGSSNLQGFENIQQLVRGIPYHPHEGHSCSKHMDLRIISLQIHFASMLMRDLHGLLKDQPMTDEEAHALIEECLAELRDPERCPIFKLYYHERVPGMAWLFCNLRPFYNQAGMGIFEYYDIDTEEIIYHVMPDPESMCEDDVEPETESLTSDVTIRTDDLPGYFVFHNGRQHPAITGVIRWFPSDNVRRYILRTLVSKWLFGGYYIGPVNEALAPVADGRRQRYALELGTKTGTWIQGMSKEFSHVHFRTVDVAPIIAHAPRSNVTFEIYDFTEGLFVASASQDVVFLNGAFEMVKDYRTLLREAYRVLRPGGLLYINDFHPHLWDAQKLSIPARRTNPIGSQLFDLARAHISKFGMDPDLCEKLPYWLAPDSDLWEGRGRGFRDITSTRKIYPAYVHDGHACSATVDASIAPFIGHLSTMSTRDMGSILVDGGMTEAEAEMMTEEMIEEMRRPECCAMLKVYIIHAVKAR
ncbi:methyltransferase domain protein [Ceratobasidium sp. AG-Ba]|nr:methyltransferase domain protein [Ceratobasidium sp. AG-Ba]QRW10954.1 methyltransferase domain protein [Ceratobasidium sp. AG-Ba]